jgi:hypothetical protein
MRNSAGAAQFPLPPHAARGLLRRLGNRPLPDWASEMGSPTWAPAEIRPRPAGRFMRDSRHGKSSAHGDNCRAKSGMLPDVALRNRISADWEASN